MTRYIKTVSSTGTSSGGSAGLTAADVCNTICTLATQAPTAGTTRIMPGFNEWVVICNCPDWNDCYGCSVCLLYTSPSPRDQRGSRMPSSA